MKKSAIFPAVVSFLAFAAFWICWWVYVMLPVKPRYFEVLPFLLPTALFAVIAWRSKHTARTAVITGVLIPVCLIGALVYGVLLQLDMATTPVTELRYYERAVERVEPALFPDAVPEDAEDACFEYLPTFLQGGEELTLAYTTEKIEDYLEIYSNQAIEIYDEEEVPLEIPYLRDTIGVAGQTLSGNYVICLLYAEPYLENNWNQGELLAVKLDVNARQIVYLYRDW